MRLNLFRKHLARELDQLPDFRMQKIQSYVLTTAVLARRIDERLGGRLKSEQVQSRQGGQLDFRQLLGMLIHYCRFEPDIYSTTLSDAEVSPEDFYFRVYSEQIKYMSEIVASFDDAVCLSRKCASTTGLHLRDVPLLASDIKFKDRGRGPIDVEEYLVASAQYPTWGSLTDDYEKCWRYTPFLPRRIDGSGYCVLIESTHPRFQPMALPFAGLADVLAEIGKRIPGSETQCCTADQCRCT